MTDTPTGTANHPPAPPVDPPKRKRRWRRWLVFAVVSVLLLAVVARVVVVFATPSVLHRVAGRYGLDCTYDRMELYLLAGDVGLWGVKLRQLGDEQPMAQVGYCRLNLSPVALLQRRLLVHRLEADAVDVNVSRDADGRVPLMDQITAIVGKAPPAASTPATGDIDLTPPFQVEALRLQRVRANVQDRAVAPPVQTTLELDVRVSDIGSTFRPTTFSVDLSSPPLLDSVRIEGQGSTRDRNFDVEVDVVALGIHPKPIAGYLTAAGLVPTADSMSARMRGSAKGTLVLPSTRPARAPLTPTVRGTASLNNVVLIVDGAEAAALRTLTIDAEPTDGDTRQLVKVVADGGRAAASRTAAGLLRAAGLEMASAPAPAPARPTSQPTTRPAAVPSVALAAIPPIDLDLTVTGTEAAYVDQATSPPTSLAVAVERLSVNGISTAPAAAAAGPRPIAIEARIGLPGLVRQLDLVGTGTSAANAVQASMQVTGQGVRPDALRAHLNAIGVASELRDASLAASLAADAQLRGDGTLGPVRVRLSDLSITDGGRVVAMANADLAGLELTAGDRPGVRVASIDLAGPEASLTLTADGQLRAAGFRTLAPDERQNAPADATAPSPSTQPASARPTTVSLPRIDIGRINWAGLRLRLRDESVTPPFETQITDAGVEARDLVIDPASDPARGSGTLRAWLNAPDVIGRFDVSGKLIPEPSGLGVDLTVAGSGIRGQNLNRYLRPLGVELLLRDGSLALHATASVAESPAGGLAASATLDKVSYRDGDAELAGIDALRLTGLTFRPGDLRLGELTVDRPRASLAREADGAVVAGGLRVPPETLQQWRDRPEPPPTTQPTVLELAAVNVSGAAIAWTDHAVTPAVETVITADAQATGLSLNRPAAAPAKFAATLGIRGALDRATAAGTLSLSPAGQSLACDVDITGLREGPLAGYTPPGINPVLADGRLKTHVEVAVAPHADGGIRAELSASSVDYRDADAPPLLALASARLAADRIDWERRLIAFDELSVAGLSARVEKRPDGATRLAGIELPPAGADAASPATAPSAPDDPALVTPATPQTGTPPMPQISVRKLDLHADELSYTDATRPDVPPLRVAAASLRSRGPIELLGDEAAAHPPAEIEFEAAVSPAAEKVVGLARVTASSAETGLQLDVAAEGISGQGVISLIPELADHIDATAVTAGRFQTHVEASVRLNRRALRNLDLSKPFDADLLIRSTEFRATPGGPVLAGVEEVSADGIRVNATRGDLSVQSLDITKPAGVVVMNPDGLNVFGWTVKLPNDDPPTPASTPAPSPIRDPAPETPAVAAGASGEVKITSLTVSGLDFRLEDRTSDPPVIVPLNEMDLTARGLTTKALTEDRPMQFSVSANAGAVPIPLKPGRRDAKSSAGGERVLFSQVSASGAVSLHPKPRGWMKGSMTGLELAPLRGIAAKHGVDLGGGTFDGTVDLRMKGDGSLDARSRSVVTDLSLRESAGGPIGRTLQLPAPLDVVIATMEAPDGSITVPLKVAVRDGELSRGQITAAATGAMASVIATAMASAPVKVGAGVVNVGTDVVKVGADVASLGGLIPLRNRSAAPSTQPTPDDQPFVITFAPGATSPDPAGQSALRALARRMTAKSSPTVALRHDPGTADESLAAARANPAPSDVSDLASSLRQRKLSLLQHRATLASRIRAELASRQDDAAARTTVELRAADRELEATESRLDALYELLRPGADRQAARRTRAACIELGQARLASVKAALADAGVTRVDDRVTLTRPAPAAPDDSPVGRVSAILTTPAGR